MVSRQLHQLLSQPPVDPTDHRPVSGMVGQKVIGYLEGPKGKLIRIQPVVRGEEFVGPGSYSPALPKMKNWPSLPTDSHRNPFGSTNTNPPPGSYDPKIAPKHHSPKYVIQEVPTPSKIIKREKDFLIDQPEWASTARASPAFISQIPRELYKAPQTKLGPGEYFRPKRAKSDKKQAESPAFKNQIQRFDDKPSETPDPAAYYIPSGFNGSPSHSFEKHFKYFPQDEPQEYPGPGSFDPRPPSAGKAVAIISTPRLPFIFNNNPGAGQYNVRGEFLDYKTPLGIQSRSGGKIKTNDWAYHPSRINPGPTDYSVPPSGIQVKIQKKTKFLTVPQNRVYYEYEYE